MKIQVTTKMVYGQPMTYPVCEKAKLFAILTNTKTFQDKHLRAIFKLGYAIEQVAEQIPTLQTLQHSTNN